LFLAVDIGREASLTMERAFWMQRRAISEEPAFVQHERVPRALQYVRRDYAPEAVPALLAGVGILPCTLHASLTIWVPKGEDGRPLGMGAKGRESPDYRGEAYTESGEGTARVVAFSPSRVEVEVRGAKQGERVVLNQNFDPGWRANGRATEPFHHAISVRLAAPDEHLVFDFHVRGWLAGWLVFGATVSLLIGFRYRFGVRA
jgi:hypothetical protein